MKIDRLETHDRLLQFKKQEVEISECCQDMIDKRPFGDHAFYIFAHPRTIGMDERFKLFNSGVYKSFEEVPSETLIWQPRLTRPLAQTNSMLFKAYPKTNLIKVIWNIPRRELWAEFKEKQMMHDKIAFESIRDFINNREKLDTPEHDDLSDNEINAIYRQISYEANKKTFVKI